MAICCFTPGIDAIRDASQILISQSVVFGRFQYFSGRKPLTAFDELPGLIRQLLKLSPDP
jgi:hypothetical protein